ncbi:uncharacterized protein LOC125252522 [Megalobrama amblycephala]|uniref:uncharacterized protein LOC125252522 n=1 Tax=Megalobrama amblycephala TaxID=75352 RepID=UPI00201447EA|nr:uncharacterized protein LOC125252522 [Megalobrama amblycephala]
MRDPCRVCGVCVQGGQCRWLFSACGRLRLAVVLSHVLGVELQRDGFSEFLCGKCVFLLERVVRCDVAIEQLQETHAAQLQQLQKERDGLKTQITNKYRQHNPTKLSGNTSQRPLKQEVQTGASLRSPKRLQSVQRPQLIQPKQRQARTDDVQDTSGRSQRLVSVGNDRQEKFKGRLRRCVSLEPLSRIGTDRSHRSKLNLCSRQSSDARSRTTGGPVARPRSLSRDYLDVVHKKSALISRSTSLQSVALEQYDHALISASPFKQTRPLKNSTPRTIETTTVVFDILQLLKSVQRVQPIPRCNGSKIPVLYTRGNAHRGVSWKSRVERSLREMEEEFNDDYTPLKQEVHCSYSGCEILMTLCLLKQ